MNFIWGIAKIDTSLESYYFLIPPLIKDTPKIPLPDPNEDAEWYPKIYIRYPLIETPFTINYGHQFKAHMELMVIVKDLSCKLFTKPDDGGSTSSQTLVDSAAELISWHTSLPSHLAPASIVFPHQLKLQSVFHLSCLTPHMSIVLTLDCLLPSPQHTKCFIFLYFFVQGQS